MGEFGLDTPDVMAMFEEWGALMDHCATQSALENERREVTYAEHLGLLKEKAVANMERYGMQEYQTLGLAVCEEAGELAQAILQHQYDYRDKSRIFEEAIDLGALCLQVMTLYNREKQHGDDQRNENGNDDVQ